MIKQNVSTWRYFDLWMTTAVILLTAYGVFMIRSAITNAPGFEGYEMLQMRYGLLGLGVMFAIASIDYRIFTAGHWYIYAGILTLLVLVFVPGIGTTRLYVEGWIDLGFVVFQPAEFARIFITISLGQFIASRQRNVGHFTNTLLTILYIGIPTALIFLQPDLGMSILFIVTWFGMIMMAGLPLRHFLILLIAGIGLFAVAYPNLAEYQQDRFTAFLDPASNPDQSFNIDQALVSIGSGGWFGKGYFNGANSQLGFLRVQHTDFIFAVVTEEMGLFFGALVVVGLLGFILLRILRVATITPDPAGRYICVGIATIILFQTVVSIGMNLRLLPVTGLTLPFVSYGGSALLSLYMGLGLVQSILMRHRKQAFG